MNAMKAITINFISLCHYGLQVCTGLLKRQDSMSYAAKTVCSERNVPPSRTLESYALYKQLLLGLSELIKKGISKYKRY